MQGDLPGASQRMEQALDLVESLRAEIARSPVSGQNFLVDLLKATWLASKQDDYAFLIDLLMERHRLEPDGGYDLQALEVNERSLARSLADSISYGIGAASEPWSSLLDDDTALLEYSLGERRSFLFAVAPDRLDVYELAPRAHLEKAARNAHALLSSEDRTLAGPRAEAALAELSRLLLKPVASRLAGQRLHHHVRRVAGLTEVEHLDDVRMADRSCDARFAQERFGHRVANPRRPPQQLDRHRPLEPLVAGEVHGRHAAFSEQALETVPAVDAISDVHSGRAQEELQEGYGCAWGH
jgi:hypothetical protein